MSNQKAKNRIVKFLNHQAAVTELDELEIWLQEFENQELFNSLVQINFAIEHEMKHFESNKVKSVLQELIAEEKKRIRLKKMRRQLSYAAAVVGVMLAIGFFLKDSLLTKTIEESPIIVNNKIETGSDKAILTLEDGSMVALEKGKTYLTKNVKSNGKEIVYGAAEKTSEELVYNFLTIPRGGQFYLALSDGTQVWLNSESQLKYPVNFIKGKPRKVELVYGEAYFAVSPSTNHNGSKFIVFNQSQEIEVLGTEFNIKAYKEEVTIYTTLVKGEVSINTITAKRVLKPSQQAQLNLEDNGIKVTTVNVYNEVSWKDGVFSFRKKPLVEIMKVLARWYGMDVDFENPELKNVGFNGVLGKDQKIEDILNTIKNFGIIKDYEISDKTLLIK